MLSVHCTCLDPSRYDLTTVASRIFAFFIWPLSSVSSLHVDMSGFIQYLCSRYVWRWLHEALHDRLPDWLYSAIEHDWRTVVGIIMRDNRDVCSDSFLYRLMYFLPFEVDRYKLKASLSHITCETACHQSISHVGGSRVDVAMAFGYN